MQLKIESRKMEDFLKEISPIIQFNTPLIQAKIQAIQAKENTKFGQAKMAFEIARDEIHHSFDTKFQPVTINAEDVLQKHEGICFAKAHLFATLCRGLGIPCGFCYQRVLRDGKTVESGYALHGLNAVYLEEFGWFRVDPRGNKPGVDSQFIAEHEKLAYPIRPELGEFDYPNVFSEPLEEVITAMKNSTTTKELFLNRPEKIA